MSKPSPASSKTGCSRLATPIHIRRSPERRNVNERPGIVYLIARRDKSASPSLSLRRDEPLTIIFSLGNSSYISFTSLLQSDVPALYLWISSTTSSSPPLMKNSSANSTKERVEKVPFTRNTFCKKCCLRATLFYRSVRQAGYCISHFQAGITLMDSPS